jgi:hypothetical protein
VDKIGQGDVWDFTVPGYSNYYCNGAIHHNSGKTAHCAVEISMAALRKHPTRTTGVNGIYMVFAPSREQLADPWGKKLLSESELMGDNFAKPMIPPYEIESIGWVHGAGPKVPKQINLKNGNRIILSISGDKNVWKRIQGKGMVLGIGVDEAAGTQDLITECLVRLLDANSHPQIQREAHGGWLLWGTTPTMVNPALESLQDKSAAGSPDIASFNITPAENPAISIAERERLKQFMDDDTYNIRMVGDTSAMGGARVYPQWDDARHVLKDDYVPRGTDSLYLGYDPGVNFTGICIGAFNAENPTKCHIVRCWEPRRTTLEHQARIIADWLQGRKLEAVMYDQNGRKMDGSGAESVIFKLMRLLKEQGIHCHQGTKMGINSYPDSVPIVRHVLTQGQLALNNSLPSGCPILRSQFLAYRFRDKSVELKQDNILRGDDHILDACRYLLSRRPSWVNRGPNLVDPQWAQKHLKAKPLDGRILSDEELREKQKMQASAQIAKGQIPGVNWKGSNRLF